MRTHTAAWGHIQQHEDTYSSMRTHKAVWGRILLYVSLCLCCCMCPHTVRLFRLQGSNCARDAEGPRWCLRFPQGIPIFLPTNSIPVFSDLHVSLLIEQDMNREHLWVARYLTISLFVKLLSSFHSLCLLLIFWSILLVFNYQCFYDTRTFHSQVMLT